MSYYRSLVWCYCMFFLFYNTLCATVLYFAIPQVEPLYLILNCMLLCSLQCCVVQRLIDPANFIVLALLVKLTAASTLSSK